jgi:hypothetical protein
MKITDDFVVILLSIIIGIVMETYLQMMIPGNNPMHVLFAYASIRLLIMLIMFQLNEGDGQDSN